MYIYLQLLDQKCGCTEGCDYTPGRFIEFNRDTTVTQILDIIYGDLSFLYCVFFRIIDVTTSINPQPRSCFDVKI